MFSNKIILILASLGLFQSVLLSIYLFTLKKENKRANIFLALILLGLTIRIGKSVINYYVPLDAWQRNIGISGILIVGPSLWFYLFSIIEKDKPFNYKKYIHFLPFVLFIIFFKIIPSNGKHENYWNYEIVVIHLGIYLIISTIYLLKNRLNLTRKVFNWCRNILIGVLPIWLYYTSNFLNLKIHYITGPIFYTFLIYSFSYLFLNRTNFSLDKYNSSNVNRTSSKAIFENIKDLFINEKMYLENNISINSVAKKLDVNPRILSQVINENKQQNFHEFVNYYRIENAKMLLTDSKYKNEKISTIAYDSGFGTTTSFNTTFKKMTKITPSEYRKKHT